jgi:hypothetical protein
MTAIPKTSAVSDTLRRADKCALSDDNGRALANAPEGLTRRLSEPG